MALRLPWAGLPRFWVSRKLGDVTVPPFVRTRSRVRTGSRSLAAWVAFVVLLGVGHVVPALHFLFVAHHLCAEHGELVDVAAENVERAREKAPNQVSVEAGSAGAHSHEHCGVLALAPAPASSEASLGAVQRLPAGEVASSAGDAQAAHIGIELLLYAPKLAPPASTV
jgi:hypothetical protein